LKTRLVAALLEKFLSVMIEQAPSHFRFTDLDRDNTGRICMTSHHLESVSLALVAQGKGILAADETIATLTRRFDTLGIPSTEQSRRTYREMLFTSPGAAEFISGVIMYDETIRQKSSGGTPLAAVLTVQGILPGIKVDTGAKPLAGSSDETVTEGLDGLRDRLKEYHGMGARFAKWRAVIHTLCRVSHA
jgi:fructose-bisphosphate aldolase, class I